MIIRLSNSLTGNIKEKKKSFGAKNDTFSMKYFLNMYLNIVLGEFLCVHIYVYMCVYTYLYEYTHTYIQ